MNIIANLFGFLALTIWISSVQVKEKKNILLLQSLANLFYACQYFIFGLTVTGLMNTVSTVRCLLFAKEAKNNKQPDLFYLLIFILILMLFGALYSHTFLDVIPLTATILYTISGWVKSNTFLRYTYIFCAGLFFYYNFTVGAYIPLIGNIGEILSGAIALFRYKKIKAKN